MGQRHGSCLEVVFFHLFLFCLQIFVQRLYLTRRQQLLYLLFGCLSSLFSRVLFVGQDLIRLHSDQSRLIGCHSRWHLNFSSRCFEVCKVFVVIHWSVLQLLLLFYSILFNKFLKIINNINKFKQRKMDYEKARGFGVLGFWGFAGTSHI